MAHQAGSRRGSRAKEQQPKPARKTGRRDTVREQARELRPLGMEAPIREALAVPAPAPEATRGPHADDRFAPLTAEHAELEGWLAELTSFVGPDEERVTRWNRVATALEAHARAEEWELYPRLRRLAPTRKMAREALDDHMHLRDFSRRLDAKQGDDPEYRALLEELVQVLHDHVELEERLLLPLAVQALGKADVDAIVGAFVRSRRKLEPAVADERVRPGPPGKRTGRSAAKRRLDEED